MPYEMRLQPAVLKKGTKYRIIQLTDLALHTTKKTPTPSVGKKFEKAFKAEEPDRIYAPIPKSAMTDTGAFTLEMIKQDPELVRVIQAEEAKGYKVLIALPKGGLPVVLGKDTVEFMNSKNGKRVLRGLAKEKQEE
jgi:hypothetical protein